jgi:hypothetical protein
MQAREIEQLAELAGIRPPEGDLALLADALATHAKLVAPLLDARLCGERSALDLDPRFA